MTLIRPYEARDREAVRHICCETAILGSPVEPLFRDREVYADLYTRYYTDYEPQHALVLEEDGVVKGYMLGCLDYRRQPRRQVWIVARAFAKVLWRLLRGRYNRNDRRYLGWLLFAAPREVPQHVHDCAHFHINIVAETRGVLATARKLYFAFFDMADRAGVRRIGGQTMLYGGHLHGRWIERYGFKVLDKKQISKFAHLRSEPVWLATVLRESPAPGAASAAPAEGAP